jgi:hypothetical protein
MEYVLVYFPVVLFILPTSLTLTFYYICCLFNVFCPSLVPIPNVVSTFPSVSTLIITRQQLCKRIPGPLLGNGFVNVPR